jgi:predicted TIM-barrel fold metal-dependent hydrolase
LTGRGLPFVDAHVHLWDLAQLRYPWLTPPFNDNNPNGSVEAIAHDYTLDDYLAEASAWNVQAIVHVEAGADPRDALAETDWLQATADARGMPNAIVAFAALNDPAIDDVLAAQTARGNVRGVRHIVNWHPDPRRTYTPCDVTGDDAWQRGFAALARHGLSFDLQAYPAQLARLAPLLERHPEVPVFVNHAGMGVDGDEDWRAGVAPLARLPHVAIKLSGFGFAFRPLDEGKVRDRLLSAIDLFGPDRAMVASDFPTDRLFGGFDQLLGLYSDAVADFTPAERHALFAGTANRLYRLGLELAP